MKNIRIFIFFFRNGRVKCLDDALRMRRLIRICAFFFMCMLEGTFSPDKLHITLVIPNVYREFTGVYIIFLISAQKRRLCVLVRTASSRRF